MSTSIASAMATSAGPGCVLVPERSLRAGVAQPVHELLGTGTGGGGEGARQVAEVVQVEVLDTDA